MVIMNENLSFCRQETSEAIQQAMVMRSHLVTRTSKRLLRGCSMKNCSPVSLPSHLLELDFLAPPTPIPPHMLAWEEEPLDFFHRLPFLVCLS